MSTATATARRMYRFRLMVGDHVEGLYNEDGSKKMVPEGADRKNQVWGSKKYTAGQIITTPVDLHKKFDQPGMPPKFMPVGLYNFDEGPDDVDEDNGIGAESMMAQLMQMPKPELVQFAEENGIDISEAKSRNQILNLLQQHLQPEA